MIQIIIYSIHRYLKLQHILPCIEYKGDISSKISLNSEANASSLKFVTLEACLNMESQ